MLAGDRARELVEARFGAAVGGIDRDVGLAVELLAAGEDATQVVHGFAIAGHRPVVALRDNARHVLLRGRLQPDGVAGREQQVIGPRLRHEAPAGGDHAALVALEHALERAALVAAVARLAVQQEDLVQAGAGLGLDFVVELDEWHAEAPREPAAQGGLAGAAQPDERDAILAVAVLRAELAHQPLADIRELGRGQALEKLLDQRELDRLAVFLADQVVDRQVQRVRDLAQEQYRDVAAPRLELGEVALRDAGVASEEFAGHAAPGTGLAHPVA